MAGARLAAKIAAGIAGKTAQKLKAVQRVVIRALLTQIMGVRFTKMANCAAILKKAGAIADYPGHGFLRSLHVFHLPLA
jgi:hypothetical protein